MATKEDAVYCTLLLSDHYLPGAVVLAHSLRDNGTEARLVVLYTPDSLQPATIRELQTVYDELIPVHPTTNHTPANLWLMDRPDLLSTFTKIELWKQTQFKRIVYIDCDVVAIRAPDELLTLEVDFAAAPDVGWPDCFNSGVMVLRPNMQDYYALKVLAERGTSFDGADQGLLNMHFQNWHRLSFTYNCTPSANYQYIPAYKHFQSTINLVHFIGAQKPWSMPRQISPAESPYNQLLGRWWAIYDSHYRPVATIPVIQLTDASVTRRHDFQGYQGDHIAEVSLPTHSSHSTTHERPPEAFRERPFETHTEIPFEQTPMPQRLSGSDERKAQEASQIQDFQDAKITPGPVMMPAAAVQPRQEEHYETRSVQGPVLSAVPHSHAEQTSEVQPCMRMASLAPSDDVHSEIYQKPVEPVFETSEQPHRPPPSPDVQTFEAPQTQWDPAREPPPLNTIPEGIALETKTYTMSDDRELFKPPPSYPEAPKDMYYEVPSAKPEPEKLSQVFPWESHAPQPTRVFADDEQDSIPFSSPVASTDSTKETSTTPMTSMTSMWSIGYTPSWTYEKPSESFESYSRSNAWDDVPDIQKYIQSMQKPRRGKVQVIGGGNDPSNQMTPYSGSSIRLTDFPSEQERPSLPVTPAPIRRSYSNDQGEASSSEQLPVAEGVPNQEDWNPSTCLEELRRRQSEILENPDLLLERIKKSAKKRDRGNL
ncbi:capsule-associated protein CAP1 [Aspergillus hancockii]|nr:capsule-associated protein CAP1 [Aspergillus hancockii]